MENLELYFNIPETDENEYISGWQALNTPDINGQTSDWHPLLYWGSDNPNEYIPLYKYNEYFGYEGIQEREIVYPVRKVVWIATRERAFADLVYSYATNPEIEGFIGLKSLKGDIKAFFHNEQEERVVWNFLGKIKGFVDIDEFLRYSFPKWYLQALQSEGNVCV